LLQYVYYNKTAVVRPLIFIAASWVTTFIKKYELKIQSPCSLIVQV